MAEIEELDRRRIGRMVIGTSGLEALHHHHGLGTEGGAQPVDLAAQMGNVGAGVGPDHRLDAPGVGQRIVDAAPAAPGMAEEIHALEAERPQHQLDLVDIARQRPERRVGRVIGSAGAELVMHHHAIAMLGERHQRVAQIVAGQAGPAIEAIEHVVALAVAVSDDAMAVDIDLVGRVGLTIVPDPEAVRQPARPRHRHARGSAGRHQRPRCFCRNPSSTG